MDLGRRGCERRGFGRWVRFLRAFLDGLAGGRDKIRGEHVHGRASRMRRRSEESTRTMFGFMVFIAVSVFLLLLAMGHRGIELFVMLALILAIVGIEGLMVKFLFDKYRQ